MTDPTVWHTLRSSFQQLASEYGDSLTPYWRSEPVNDAGHHSYLIRPGNTFDPNGVGFDRLHLWVYGPKESQIVSHGDPDCRFLSPQSSSSATIARRRWRLPAAKADLDGPVLVTVEYDVSLGRESEFLEAMREYGRVRRRDGASRWGISKDLEASTRYVETFVVPSWEEHLRQHDRLIRADSELEDRIHRYTRLDPIVRHLQYL